MQLTRRSIAWTFGAIVVLASFFILGVAAGMKHERNRFEFAKDSSPALADEFLAKGDFDKALSLLHFSKSFEARVGWTDAELGKAYLAKGQSCLAQDFLESGLEWMIREKLSALDTFATTQNALAKATVQCAAVRRVPPIGVPK